MTPTTTYTIQRWTADGRRFVPVRPSAATHYCRDSRRYLLEVTRTNPRAGLTHAVYPSMRTARPDRFAAQPRA